jgi:AraC family transcriptional regulator of adaptative response/methylated-DNA-[protein]-cysteine methyltransferase
MDTNNDTHTRYWQAVQDRDSGYDGTFVYAVRTTGIYCRPSCPSRRAKREHVTFYATPEDARAGGFRACRRCLPDEAGPQLTMVRQVCALIDGSDTAPTLAALSKQVHVSPFHLQRTFKRLMGVSPRQYAEARRAQRLKQDLQDGASVTDALYNAGFGSSSRLYEQESFGMTPGTYRRKGKGMDIHYTFTDTVLGRLLLAATKRGICAAYFGDDDAALEAMLADEFPAAQRHPAHDSERLNDWAAALANCVAGSVGDLYALPLDVQGTAFQARVWQALRDIPRGKTATYSSIAQRIGEPSAARAVARACATNKLAVLIPCHRVVREDGDLAGYRWGLARKHKLLADEAQAVAIDSAG